MKRCSEERCFNLIRPFGNNDLILGAHVEFEILPYNYTISKECFNLNRPQKGSYSCHGMTESVKVHRKDQSVIKNAYFYYFGQFHVLLEFP